MDTLKVFKEIMAAHTEIALATCSESLPNVRIVNFHYSESKKCLYFSSFLQNPKVSELELNPKVAFTTIPHSGNRHVRGTGIAKKSEMTIFDLEEAFTLKIPDYGETIKSAGEYLILYEIAVETVVVTGSMQEIEALTL